MNQQPVRLPGALTGEARDRMQTADFLAGVSTTRPPTLRAGPPSFRFPRIDDASRRGGVETLALEAEPPGAPGGTPEPARPPLPAERLHTDPARRRDGGRSLGSKHRPEPDADLDERFRSLAPWLERTLRRRYGGPDVDDLVQESFIRLARYDAQQRGRRPRALLLRIAGNLLRDAGRRAGARRRNLHVSIDAAGFDESRLVQAADQHATLALKDAILRLPVPLRDVFLMSRFTPLTNAEIGARLGISTKTVEWRIGRAMALCLAELGG